MSRPKKEWHVGNNQKKELQKESKKDLANIRSKFDEHAVTQGQRKREQKREQKEAAAALKNGGSLFVADAERSSNKNDKKDKSKRRQSDANNAANDENNEVGQKRVFKDAKTDAYEKNKWRGKRNSIGAKMAKFKGGNKNFRRSGGGIGDRDLSGKSSKQRENRGGFIPDESRKEPLKKGGKRGGNSKKGGNKKGPGKGGKGGKGKIGSKR